MRSSKDIFGKPLSKKDQSVVDRIAAEQAAGDFSNINFEDIPELTPEQLARVVQARRRPAKISVGVRLDPAVLEWLKAKGNGAGHLTLINDILVNLMEAERQTAAKAEPLVGAR